MTLPRASLRKWSLRLAGAALAVGATYYVGVNAVLATPLGEKLMNLRPDLAQIHYVRAWTLVPLRVEVRGFRLSIQDDHIQLFITAERASGRFHPLALRARRVSFSDLDGEGVTLHLRTRIKPGDPREKELSGLPLIEGYATPVLDESANEAREGGLEPMSVLLANLEVRHLREAWVDRVRYTGDATVTGGLFLEPSKRLRLDSARFTDAKSELTIGGPRHVTIEKIDVHASSGVLDLTDPDLGDLRLLDADVNVSADVDPRFLNTYLTRISGLSTLTASGEPGRLEVAVRLAKGVVLEGSELSYATKRLSVRLPFVEVSGTASVKGRASGGWVGLGVVVSTPTLHLRDGSRLADAKRFVLNAESPTALGTFRTVDGTLTLTGGRMEALTALNQFIPAGTGLHLVAGKGLLDASLRLESRHGRGHGQLDLVGEAVRVKNRSATLEGRLVVHGEVRSVDVNSGALDLAGSTIALEAATLRAGTRTWPHLWVRAVTERCLLTPQGKTLWNADLSVGASNLEPLLAVVSANVPVPSALSLFTDSPNVRAQASIEVRNDGVELPHLGLTSDGVRAEGALSLRERGDAAKTLEPWGGVLVHVGPIHVGVQLDGSKTTVVLLDLERWAASRKLVQSAP